MCFMVEWHPRSSLDDGGASDGWMLTLALQPHRPSSTSACIFECSALLAAWIEAASQEGLASRCFLVKM